LKPNVINQNLLKKHLIVKLHEDPVSKQGKPIGPTGVFEMERKNSTSLLSRCGSDKEVKSNLLKGGNY
jgi:hypothetical protein